MVNLTFWKTCAFIGQTPVAKKGGRVIWARKAIGKGNSNRKIKKGKT